MRSNKHTFPDQVLSLAWGAKDVAQELFFLNEKVGLLFWLRGPRFISGDPAKPAQYTNYAKARNYEQYPSFIISQ